MHSRLLGIALLGGLCSLLGAAPAIALGNSRGGPGTPITKLPYVIDAPGEYTLIGNLRGMTGIIVNASNVTVDLGGYLLSGLPGSSDGILVRGDRTSISVLNGTIASWGGHGILADAAFNSSFHDLRLSDNSMCGLRAGHGAVVINVVSQANGGSGVVGLEAVVVTGGSFTGNMGFGLEVGAGSVVNGICSMQNLGGGIFADAGSRIAGNAVSGNGLLGAPTDNGCSAATRAGIAVLGGGTVVEDNVLTGNSIGLQLLNAGNVARRNVVKGSTDNYDIVAGNQLQLLLCEVPESIDWPAAIVLAGTLTGTSGKAGITVNASGVSIDLAGNTLQGVPGSLAGIVVPVAVNRLAVRNGSVSGWGGIGIDAKLAHTSNFGNLIVEGNGAQGLVADSRCTLEGVNASSNGIDGILTGDDTIVTMCIANGNGNDGIHVGEHSTITNCEASENTLFGIKAFQGCTVRTCTASHNNFGISAEGGASISDCTASFNTGVAIRVMDGGCSIFGNSCRNSQYGIAVLGGSGSRIDSNNMAGNQFGLVVPAKGNFIVRNSATSSTAMNYDINGENTYGVIITTDRMFTDADPWANFAF